MRRLTIILTMLIALTGAFGPSATSAAPATGNLTAQIAPNARAVTTDRLNLRSGPSLGDDVLAVMPAGASVTLSGQQINGFLFVDWDGRKGWAHGDYLSVQAPAPGETSTAITTDRLNMRSGPALDYSVVTVLPLGADVILTGQEINGYRSITYNGQDGWVFGAYLAEGTPSPAPNDTAVTTDRLNLRSGPSLGDGVLTVVPAGGTVTLTGERVNGYRSVTWSGFDGWVHGDYLDTGSAPTPDPEPEPGSLTNAVTTDALNLRSGPDTTYTVLAVIPPSTKIVLTGESSGAYLAVSWNGQNGWAHRDWIVADGSQPAPVETATTTDTLNLRAGPATSYAVLGVMPAGAQVTLTGQTNNGFHSVAWNGQNGWAFSAYLSTGTAPPPDPPAPEPEPEPAPFDVTNTIVGPARGSADEAIAFARRAGAVRMDEVERYIHEVYFRAPQVGFDPAIIVAQSALETGYWQSDRWRLELNPAGLGISGGPGQIESVFPDGMVAARAQLAHMHAEVYGSSQPLPPVLQGVDPTYQQVFQAGWAGTIRTVADLSGTWAVDPEYHHKIIRVAREMFG